MRIYLAGHGEYGISTFNTLKFFKDDIPNVDYMEFNNHFEEDMENYFKRYSNEKIIVITDLLSGSVNTCAMRLSRNYDIQIFTGVNISFLLELLFASEINDDYLNGVLSESKNQMIYVNEMIRALKHD